MPCCGSQMEAITMQFFWLFCFELMPHLVHCTKGRVHWSVKHWVIPTHKKMAHHHILCLSQWPIQCWFLSSVGLACPLLASEQKWLTANQMWLDIVKMVPTLPHWLHNDLNHGFAFCSWCRLNPRLQSKNKFWNHDAGWQLALPEQMSRSSCCRCNHLWSMWWQLLAT